jgi:large subunit ribosomal protein L15
LAEARAQDTAVLQQEDIRDSIQDPVLNSELGLRADKCRLQRRVPKFGFKNFARTEYNILNLADIQILVDSGKFSEGKIDKELLISSKIIRGLDKPLKILGNGELKAKLEISANAFSKAAVEKIEKGGGKAITI